MGDFSIDTRANLKRLLALANTWTGVQTFNASTLVFGGDQDIGAYDLRAATLTADGLTSGRVIFATTNGRLTDDADFTFATDTLTVTKIAATILTGAMNLNAQTCTNFWEWVTSQFLSATRWYPNFTADWGATAVLGGTQPIREPMGTILRSSATANSSERIYLNTYGLNDNSGNRVFLDWSNKLLFFFKIAASASDAEAVRYVQLKESSAIGGLAQRGIGVKIANLTVTGISYGATGSEAGTATIGTLTATRPMAIAILHDPTVPSITWYVDGVSAATQSTTGNIPQVIATTNTYLLASTANGASGNNTDLDFMCPFIWYKG